VSELCVGGEVVRAGLMRACFTVSPWGLSFWFLVVFGGFGVFVLGCVFVCRFAAR